MSANLLVLDGKIWYRSGFKYQLHKDALFATGITEQACMIPRYVTLYQDGRLLIKAGYAWDGPSGPMRDTKNLMRPSLVHDALYQLMRESKLSFLNRKAADKLFYRMARLDGVSLFRASYAYAGLRIGAGYAAAPQRTRILEAP